MELDQIAEALSLTDSAIQLACEMHGANDYLLSGSVLRLLERRVDLLIAGERAVAGTADHHVFDAEIKITMDRLLAAQSMFAALSRSMAEQQAATFH